VSRGEEESRFRLGIGIDVKNPLLEAVGFLAPASVVADRGPAPQPLSSWFFHADARNMLATSWSLLEEGGRAVGYRVRLLETEGRQGRMQLRSFRRPAAARQVDFLGRTLAELIVSQDAVQIDFTPHEWIEAEVRLE
jgi:hypothetical protein